KRVFSRTLCPHPASMAGSACNHCPFGVPMCQSMPIRPSVANATPRMASASFMLPGWAIVGLAALLAGCGSDTEPGQGSPANMEPDGGPSEKQPGPLPGSSTDGDCEADEPVELCAWADAADAV